VLGFKSKPANAVRSLTLARLEPSARLGLFCNQDFSGNLARLTDKVLVDESHIGLALSSEGS
jgi:hypothetical protein